MNFKKYQVSKNLFDELYPDVTTTIVYKAINVGNGSFTLSTNAPLVNNGALLFMLAGDVTTGASTSNNGVSESVSRTVTAVNGYITIAYIIRGGKSPADYEVMLNAGSQPLPYEPYGNTWHDIPHYIHNTSTDTLTTLPAVLYPNAVTATVGLKGQMQQSGTPIPQNPIQPSETGERTENLFYTIMKQRNIDSSGKIITDVGDMYDLWIAKVEEGETYTASKVAGCYGFFATEPYGGAITIDGTRILSDVVTTFTVPTGANYVAIRYIKDSVSKMCNSGFTLLPYQPYGYKLDIKSANTTTPVYLGEVETTRRIRKYEFTGQESFFTDTSSLLNNTLYFGTRIGSTTFGSNRESINSHFRTAPKGDNPQALSYECSGFNPSSSYSDYYYMRINIDTIGVTPSVSPSAATTAFTTWLAAQYANGTPVAFWYVLVNGITSVTNEPLRKIGDYADTISGITIPTITGKDTFDVLTTLKPSEVSLNYTGWHDATVKEWDGSDWE